MAFEPAVRMVKGKRIPAVPGQAEFHSPIKHSTCVLQYDILDTHNPAVYTTD